jgi:glycosyltransferase involved in cell wall biosynthesis
MEASSLDLTLLIPLFNEDESLPELTEWIVRVVTPLGLSYEILLVDDGSRDKSWEVIGQLATRFPAVRGLRFTRNQGKSAALNTGFHYCRGRVVITMDADLQDSPDEIPALYNMIVIDGYDLVSGWKRVRHDPISKTIPSKFFNGATRWMSGIPLHDFNCGLKAYRSNVVKAIEVYGEMHRYIPVIAKWNGFDKITEKVVEHRARKYGVSKFGLERFVNGFLDLMSISFVSRFKKKPMHFFGLYGSLSFFVGFGIAIYLMLDKLVTLANHERARNVTDQPLFFLALVAIILGSQMFLAGFLGEMITQSSNKKSDYPIGESVGYEETPS